jgi:hypothetical protein
MSILLYAMFYMHPRNSEILAPVMRTFGSKRQEQFKQASPLTDQRPA